jgi:Ca2+-binding RTX toxin-like protein
MKKQLALLVLGLVGVLLVTGRLAHAAGGFGPGLRDPEDAQVEWEDAGDLAFERGQAGNVTRTFVVKPGHVAVILRDGTPRGFRPQGGSLLIEQDGRTVVADPSSGSAEATLGGVAASWSPDGTRIAYLNAGVLYLADERGANDRSLGVAVARPSEDRTGPVWSPDGTEVVVSTTTGAGSQLVAVNADGSGAHVLFEGAGQNVDPSWNPDGSLMAFERNVGGTWAIWTYNSETGSSTPLTPGSENARFPQFDPASPARLAFISDRAHIPGGATRYQYALYVAEPPASTHWTKLLDDVHPYSPPRWLRDGSELATTAGEECYRWGVYIVEPSKGHGRRITNPCRFTGTNRDDVLFGSDFLDYLRGLAGNDRILARNGRNRIEGNAGNDIITSGTGADAIFGGPGNDRIAAGGGNDLIVGGTGRDTIVAGPGNDTLETRDGFRDVVDCGPGRDRAEVDRLDALRGCERVLRR